MDELAFIKAVLALFQYDSESLTWQPEPDGRIWFGASCSDFFEWACSDAEEITSDDLPMLEQARADLVAVSSGMASWLGELYSARKRGMRPQGAYYTNIPEELWPLFDAVGPARTTDIWNPYPHPSKIA